MSVFDFEVRSGERTLVEVPPPTSCTIVGRILLPGGAVPSLDQHISISARWVDPLTEGSPSSSRSFWYEDAVRNVRDLRVDAMRPEARRVAADRVELSGCAPGETYELRVTVSDVRENPETGRREYIRRYEGSAVVQADQTGETTEFEVAANPVSNE